jgi:hypothetical protein
MATPRDPPGAYGPHRIRAWLTVVTALSSGSIGLFSGSIWPTWGESAAAAVGVLEVCLSILVLRWPRGAGIMLLVVAPFQVLVHSGPPVVWWDLLAGVFGLAAGVLAESARRPDGYRFFIARVLIEIVIFPLVSTAVIVIAIVAVALSML